MLTGHYTDVEAVAPGMPDAQATIRWLITREKGARHFAMRVIEIAGKGDRIPLHAHDYEHEVFVLEGTGRALTETGSRDLVPGDYVFVEPGEKHGFENTGTALFRFICVIPNPA
ncbi:MAG: cupin domain-containing protein [candidate division WOR-3 bacterium]|nr:MAG: cupin domain-containing protein [candidate division WOR-3 bacterium]